MKESKLKKIDGVDNTMGQEECGSVGVRAVKNTEARRASQMAEPDTRRPTNTQKGSTPLAHTHTHTHTHTPTHIHSRAREKKKREI